MRSVVATIQARMSSSRLPGKVLKKICGKPMLLWQVERIRQSRLIDDVIIGTSISKADDLIANFCFENNIKFFRGSENDVLDRIANLLEKYNVDFHAEFYGDSPLPDPQIIDEIIGFYFKNFDTDNYVSNAIKTTYPPGLEVSIYSSHILKNVNNLVAIDDPLREHVGFNITRFPELYNQISIEAPRRFNFPEIYLEVDTNKDLILIQKIFSYFKSIGFETFGTAQIIEFLQNNPELIKINNEENRRWKEFRRF